jgi:ParB/RepB/Spo0J family partition protein
MTAMLVERKETHYKGCVFTEDPISKARCQKLCCEGDNINTQCGKFQCQSPFRLCRLCVKDKSIKDKRVVVDYLTGLCAEHENSSEQPEEADDGEYIDPQEVDWNRLMAIARKAVDGMVHMVLDPAQCRPMKSEYGGQPRTDKNVGLDDLEVAIRSVGQVMPGIVQKASDGMYEILAGERRWTVITRIGGLKFKAYCIELEDQKALPFVMACLANGNTSPLKPLEMCAAIERLYDVLELPMDFIASVVFGISQQKAANYHRLIHLREEVRAMLAREEITESDAFATMRKPHNEQLSYAQDLIAGKALRQLPESIPTGAFERKTSSREPNRSGSEGYRAKSTKPVDELDAYARRLRSSVEKFEKALKRVDLIQVLKGRPTKKANITEAVSEAAQALARCDEVLKSL